MATAKKAAKKARRTVMYSSGGKKLYAVRDKTGRFKDIQQYSRAHAMDIKRGSSAEAKVAAKKAAKSVARTAKGAKSATGKAAGKVAKKVGARVSKARKVVKSLVSRVKRALS